MVESKQEVKAEESGYPAISAQEYRSAKRKLLKYEETNYDTIALLPCSGQLGWCEMGDHSALIYYYKVAQQLGVKVNFDVDVRDFYNQFKYGVIKTRGFDAVRKRLLKVGLLDHETIRDRRAIFYLNKRFTDREIKEMWNEEQARRDEIGRVLKVSFADPAIHQRMVHVGARIHTLCLKHLDRVSSATMGRKMVTAMDEMLRTYYTMTDKKPDELKEYWQKLMDLARELIIDVQIMSELGLWTRVRCVEVGEQLSELEKCFAKKIK